MAGAGRRRKAPSPLVCILSTGDWRMTNRAIASARRFGLEPLVGVTGQDDRGTPHAGARIVPIEWRDDFADARNRLAAKARADYLLWLDSDEELIAFPRLDWDRVKAARLSVLIQERSDLAPRLLIRVHRNEPGIRWAGAVHELPEARGGRRLGPPVILGGAAIRHRGYESGRQIAAKLRRDHRIAKRARVRMAGARDVVLTSEDFKLALTEAAYEEVYSKSAMLHWIRAFKHPKAVPPDPAEVDGRVVPASWLCDYDTVTPALKLLEQNPLIFELQFAVLRAGYRASSRIDKARLDFLCRAAQAGMADRRYNYPLALLGGEHERIVALIQESTAGEAVRPPKGRRAPGLRGKPMTTRYVRSETVDQETLDDDLIVMNTENFEIVTLNPTAQAVWRALEAPVTIDELAADFAEAFPDVLAATLRRDIRGTVKMLFGAGLVHEAIGD